MKLVLVHLVVIAHPHATHLDYFEQARGKINPGAFRRQFNQPIYLRRRRVVAGLGVDAQRRQSLQRCEPDLDRIHFPFRDELLGR